MDDLWMTAHIEDIAASDSRSIAIGPFGSALKSDVYTQSGIPVVRGQDISSGKQLTSNNRVYVSEATAARFPACLVRQGDLVFPHRGAIGRVGIIGDEVMLLSSSMMKLTVDDRRIDPLFIFYYFRGPGRDELLARASTVGTPGIGQPLASLRRIAIRFPSLKTQQRIAGVLAALDDKIAADEHSLRLAALLGRSLFIGEAIRGESVKVNDAASLMTRGVTPKYRESDGVVVVNQKCVRNHRIDLAYSRRTEPLRSRPERMLQRNDTLVNSTGQGTLGRVARWIRADHDATVDSHITIVRFDESVVDPACAGVAMLGLEGQIELLAEGSTGQTELRRDLLGALELRLPPLNRQRALGRRLRGFDDLLTAYSDQIDRLAETRDTLLPLLMSGKLRVRDAEKVVEGVA